MIVLNLHQNGYKFIDSACIYYVSNVCSSLGYVSFYISQLLFCHSFYSYFQKEEEEEIEGSSSETNSCFVSVTNQVMQKENNSDNIRKKEDSNPVDSQVAFDLSNEIDIAFNRNIRIFKKYIRSQKAEKAKTKYLMSSIPQQIFFVLFNSPQPLQLKIDEVLLRIKNRFRNTLKISTKKKECITKYEPLDSPTTAEEELEESEEDNCYYIPIMLNHSTASSIPVIGEQGTNERAAYNMSESRQI